MKELPIAIQRSIRKYEKVITTDGLTLYPVLVKEYEDFEIGRPALEVMHQSLPVAMMRLPLLAALFQMDFEAVRRGEAPNELFARALVALVLSLRLGEGMDLQERIGLFRMELDPQRPEKLLNLHYAEADGTEKTISASRFAELRRIIAAQNGVTVESDEANPEIVKAKKAIGATGPPLESSVDALISAVAALSGATEAEIEEWPILMLQKRAEAYRRILEYLVCGMGEMSGASWKSGNPVPHPFFRRSQDGNDPTLLSSGGAKKQTTKQMEQIIQQAPM